MTDFDNEIVTMSYPGDDEDGTQEEIAIVKVPNSDRPIIMVRRHGGALIAHQATFTSERAAEDFVAFMRNYAIAIAKDAINQYQKQTEEENQNAEKDESEE